MPTTEERVTTLEEIARNHAALLQRQQQSIELLTTLAEGSARMEQRITSKPSPFPSPFQGEGGEELS